MPIHWVGVVGAGTMGRGVSLALANSGLNVVLIDVLETALEGAMNEIAHQLRLRRLLGTKHQGAEKPGKILARIRTSTSLDELAEVDFIIENVTESWEIKETVYQRLDSICRDGIVFAVNTSAIPITRVAGITSRPDRVVGMHFMNPAHLMPLVEIIQGFHSSESTLAQARGLVRALGKDSVVVRDSPGFVTNRVMMLMVNEAIFLLHEGISTAPDVDRLFKTCFGHPMGPLETADLIGLDTVLLSLEVLYEHLRDSKFRPCPLLQTQVYAGRLGRKSGAGFFEY